MYFVHYMFIDVEDLTRKCVFDQIV